MFSAPQNVQTQQEMPPPQTQQQKELNIVSLCRMGQETVQDIMSRTQEVFQTLKTIQLPNGTPHNHMIANDRKFKIQELLRTIRILFKRLRLIYDKCNEDMQIQGMEYTHIESLIPFKDENDNNKYEEKKNTDAYSAACQERDELLREVTNRNAQLKEIVDRIRRVIWEINTMMSMRKS